MYKKILEAIGFVTWVVIEGTIVALTIPLWVKMLLSAVYGISLAASYLYGKEEPND